METLVLLKIEQGKVAEVTRHLRHFIESSPDQYENVGLYLDLDSIWFKTIKADSLIIGPSALPYLAETVIDLGNKCLEKNVNGTISHEEYLKQVALIPESVRALPFFDRKR